MKKTALVALVALTASATADDMSKSGNGQMKQRHDSGMMNVSAYPMIDSHKWDLFGDALYWHVAEGGTEWAQVNKNESATVGESNVKHVDFNWNWGFKVGIGYNSMKHDEWDTQLYFTWLHASRKQTAAIAAAATATPNHGIVSLFTTPSTIGESLFKEGTINWKIHFNMFDWELARNYYVSKHLALRPHIGLKGGWINQHAQGHFQAFDNRLQTFHMDNDFWGVGPRGGVNTKWNLGNINTHFFSMLGDFSGALMWGHWSIDQRYSDAVNLTQKSDNRDRNQMASVLQAFFGLGWDANFHSDQCHFSMKLGYELQYWFAQNQLWQPNGFNTLHGDLTLQGGTLEIRFDF